MSCLGLVTSYHAHGRFVCVDRKIASQGEGTLICTNSFCGLGAGYPDTGFEPGRSYLRVDTACNHYTCCLHSKHVKPHALVPILQMRPSRLREVSQLVFLAHAALNQLQNVPLVAQTPQPPAAVKLGTHFLPHRCPNSSLSLSPSPEARPSLPLNMHFGKTEQGRSSPWRVWPCGHWDRWPVIDSLMACLRNCPTELPTFVCSHPSLSGSTSVFSSVQWADRAELRFMGPREADEMIWIKGLTLI